jgi:hypothetical protein
MKRTFNYLIIYLFISTLMIQCASSSAGIATSNVPIVEKKYKVIGPVESQRDWYTFDVAIFGVPFQKPPIQEMVDTMIQEKEADALINIRYWSDRSVFLFITRNRIGINAEAISFEKTTIKVEDATPKKK